MKSKTTLRQHREARIAKVSGSSPFTNIHSCKHCSQLQIIIEKEWTILSGASDDPKTFLIENLTKELLRAAVNDGCEFFRDARSNEYHLLKSPFRLEVSASRDKSFSVKLAPKVLRRKNIWRNIFPQHNRLSLDKGSEGPKWLHESRLEQSSALTSGALLEVKQIMRHCGQTKKHKSCPKSPKDFVPTRLIEIPTDESTVLRIVKTKLNHYVPWCSLSYCWGGPQKLCSTTLNFKDEERTIEFAHLPATIKDAVIVAKILEIPYLWVDSLCIIQDDRQDIERELAIAPLIYKNCVLTICAAMAHSATQGFLHPWQIGGEGFNTPFQLHYKLVDQGRQKTSDANNEDGTKGAVILYGGVRNGYNYPLFQRAWALQEYVLSPRVLIFGANGLRWECMQETPRLFPPGTPEPSIHEDIIAETRTLLSKNKTRSDEDYAQIWDDILEHYCERKISFADDKLNALAGLAEEVGNQSGYEYVAGVWKQSIQRFTCWHHWPSETSRRPDKYRAPSWSWASVNNTDALWNHIEVLATSVMEVYAEPAVESLPYGNARSGYMKLHCKSREATLKQREVDDFDLVSLELKPDGHGRKAAILQGRSDEEFVSDDTDSDEDANRYMTFEISLDAAIDDFDGWEDNTGWDVHLFLLTDSKKAKEKDIDIVMIAKKIPGKDEAYQRVGLCIRRKGSKIFREAFRGVQKRTVTIM